MDKHCVEYISPGPQMCETLVVEVKNRDPSKINLPKDCFGYRFFDRTVADTGDEKLFGERRNYSGIYYFGKVKTLDDIKKDVLNGEVEEKVLELMEIYQLDKIVKTRLGNYMPFNNNDKIISRE
ncbi:hypothetical protein JW949_02020 [Candidatus Woesearchaeota archaeon]|nr:hypothetical protein [Candidatus Woesearchaeota archaeon]